MSTLSRCLAHYWHVRFAPLSCFRLCRREKCQSRQTMWKSQKEKPISVATTNEQIWHFRFGFWQQTLHNNWLWSHPNLSAGNTIVIYSLPTSHQWTMEDDNLLDSVVNISVVCVPSAMKLSFAALPPCSSIILERNYVVIIVRCFLIMFASWNVIPTNCKTELLVSLWLLFVGLVECEIRDLVNDLENCK